MATLPVQAVATAATIFLTINSVGVDDYATIGLIVGLQALFGFLNLGTSASLANAAGESLVCGNQRLFAVLVTATRVIGLMGVTLILSSVAVAALGLWPTLLGGGDPQLLTVGALMVVVSVALLQVFGQGLAILMNTGRWLLATLATTAASVVSLILVGISSITHAAPLAFVASAFGGQLVVAVVCALLAARVVGISLRRLSLAVLERGYVGARLGHEARPALVMWLMLPIAYQTDRLLLSHLSTPDQLAAYNVSSQFFTALFSIVAAGSAVLWGVFSRARAEEALPSAAGFVRLTLGFTSVGIVLALGYVLTTPWVVGLITGRRVTVSIWLAVAFGMLLVAQSFHQPSAMIQTDPAGLRFNAIAVSVMAVANLGLGLLLTRSLGAVGPVAASVMSMTVALALPSFVRARGILGKSG